MMHLDHMLKSSRKPLFLLKMMRTYRQTAGFQRGHAASGGWSGVQNILLGNFELSTLRRHIALPHGHQNRVFIAALQPLFRLHGRLWPCCVGVQVILEEVRLRDGHKKEEKPPLLHSAVCERQ